MAVVYRLEVTQNKNMCHKFCVKIIKMGEL